MSQAECAETRRWLSAYRDGELDQRTAEVLLAHVQECTECATFFRTFVKTLELYDDLPKPLLSDQAHARLKRAVEIE